VTYAEQDAKERIIGSVKRGIQEVRFFHKDLGFVRVNNTHAQAYPEHWAERSAQMRTMGLLMRDGDPSDVVIGGGDLNAAPYYSEDTHVQKNGDKVGDWYKNGMSYWSLLHYAGGNDAALAGRSAAEAQADVTASHTAPTTPGWPHTATNLNEHYAAQYDERPARLDHLVTAGNRQVKVANSAVEFTERRADVGGSLSDHYGVSVNLEIARPL
jgi:endonuclease/exonuclease/phosphatase family metal-dependent hydrolase